MSPTAQAIATPCFSAEAPYHRGRLVVTPIGEGAFYFTRVWRVSKRAAVNGRKNRGNFIVVNAPRHWRSLLA
jgi:hypothetical protein